MIGIGSLLLQEKSGDETVDGNMFVPVDLLEPILDDLLRTGRSAAPRRPWLGMYTADAQGRLVVNGLATGGPAERAGVARAISSSPLRASASRALQIFSARSGDRGRRAPRSR